MRTVRSFACLAAGALLLLALPVRGAEVNKFLPDDTEFVMTVNMQQIMDSPLVKKYAMEHIKVLMQSDDHVKKTLEALGFDPLKDLTSLTAAGAGFGPDSKGIIIAQGKFDQAKVEAYAEKMAKDNAEAVKVDKFENHKIFEIKVPGEDKPMFAAVVDSQTIIAVSDKAGLKDAFDRAAGKKQSNPRKELLALLEKVDTKQSMWMALPASVLAKSPLGEDYRAKKIVEKIDNVTMGFTVSKGLQMGVTVLTKTADGAKELTEEVKTGLEQAKGFVALIAGQQKELAPLADLIGSIKVETEGTKIMLKSEVSEELIDKNLKKN